MALLFELVFYIVMRVANSCYLHMPTVYHFMFTHVWNTCIFLCMQIATYLANNTEHLHVHVTFIHIKSIYSYNHLFYCLFIFIQCKYVFILYMYYNNYYFLKIICEQVAYGILQPQ